MNLIFLLLTAAAFFQNFPDLRSCEKWEEIAALGEESLPSATPSEAVKIHADLASSYFYLGDFLSAERHAQSCYELAVALEDQIHGLYLLSAVQRAYGNFEKARQIALLALPNASGELKAKVLFNLAAAEADDPEGDLDAAQTHLKEALSLFEREEDRQRSAIRLSKVYLLQGNLQSARELLVRTLPEISSRRIQMHAEYLLAQVEKCAGDDLEALQIAKRALQKAQQLDAAKDAARIGDFCESLKRL